MAARGRPRKPNVPRDSKGRIASGYDRERPEAIRATAEEARVRQFLGVEVWQTARKNEKAILEARKTVGTQYHGYALGILYYTKQISRDQHDAGGYFADLWKAWASIRGVPSPNIPAIDYGAVKGFSVHPERSEGWRNDINRRWEGVQTALYNANGDQGRTTDDIYSILRRSLVENIGPLNAYELGNLRVGLNAINQARGV